MIHPARPGDRGRVPGHPRAVVVVARWHHGHGMPDTIAVVDAVLWDYDHHPAHRDGDPILATSVSYHDSNDWEPTP